MTRIQIIAGEITVDAELNNSNTAQQIIQSMPIEGEGNRWGDEIYFSIPVDTGSEDPQSLVQMGDLGYWPPGKAFCIFFGPTPISSKDEIRPASEVNIIGKVTGDPSVFKKVQSGTKIILKKVE